MDMMELIQSRHSIRQYLNKPIEPEKREILNALAEECNQESGLHIQIFYDEPSCFQSLFSKIVRFQNCTNYIAIVGKSADPKLEEKSGYYGEQLVLKAQELGLGTCWVGITRKKGAAVVNPDEKQVIVIALGYGANNGIRHKSKTIGDVSNVVNNLPSWYLDGVKAALLAPTAINQQKFHIFFEDENVRITAEKGPYSIVDLGIVKYHFEAVSHHKVLD